MRKSLHLIILVLTVFFDGTSGTYAESPDSTAVVGAVGTFTKGTDLINVPAVKSTARRMAINTSRHQVIPYIPNIVSNTPNSIPYIPNVVARVPNAIARHPNSIPETWMYVHVSRSVHAVTPTEVPFTPAPTSVE